MLIVQIPDYRQISARHQPQPQPAAVRNTNDQRRILDSNIPDPHWDSTGQLTETVQDNSQLRI